MTDEQITEWVILYGTEWVPVKKLLHSELVKVDLLYETNNEYLERLAPTDIGGGWYCYKLTDKAIRRIQNEK